MFSYAFRSLSILFTTLYLLISVGACSVPPQEEVYTPVSDLPHESDKPVPIHVLQSVADINRQLQLATEQYCETADTAVEFNIQTVANREDYRSTLRSKLLAGEVVDLFHLLGRDDVERLEDYLEDLSASWAVSALPGTLDTVLTDDALLGIPYSVQGIGLIVNKTIFDAAGIAISDINSFERLSEAFTQLQEQISAGELAGLYPQLEAVTDLSLLDKSYTTNIFSELLLSHSFLTPVQAYYSPTVEFPEGDGVESYLKLLAQFSPHNAAWQGFLGVSDRQLVANGILSGRIAVVLHNTDILSRIPDIDDDHFEFSLLPVHFENNEQGAIFTRVPAWWAIHSESTDTAKAEAIRFLEWLYTSQAGGDILSDQFQANSPYPATKSNSNPCAQQLYAAIESQAALPSLSQESPGKWLETVLSPEMQEYFSKYEKSWEEVQDTCKEGWTLIFNES